MRANRPLRMRSNLRIVQTARSWRSGRISASMRSGSRAASPAHATRWKSRALRRYARALSNPEAHACSSTGLRDSEPRVRAAAITALRRLGKTDAAPSILPLVADADPVVAHLAVRALSELKAVQPCLAALDSSDDKGEARRAARALRHLRSRRRGRPHRAAARREGRPAPRHPQRPLPPREPGRALRTDPSVWWGTRPDTSGPVYQPIAWSETEKITAALKTALEASQRRRREVARRAHVCHEGDLPRPRRTDARQGRQRHAGQAHRASRA